MCLRNVPSLLYTQQLEESYFTELSINFYLIEWLHIPEENTHTHTQSINSHHILTETAHSLNLVKTTNMLAPENVAYFPYIYVYISFTFCGIFLLKFLCCRPRGRPRCVAHNMRAV